MTLIICSGALADQLAQHTEVKRTVAAKLLAGLSATAATELKKAGIFTVPGVHGT